MTIAVLVATFGSSAWRTLGDRRALASVAGQEADEVVRVHQDRGSVALARNEAAARSSADWLVFLDGDDELAPGYAAAMRGAAAAGGEDHLYTPAVSYAAGTRRKPPMFHPQCDPSLGNWMVIGTMVERAVFERAGGFDDRPEYGGYEDWALWIKCQKLGAAPVRVPDAVYVAHVDPRSRHRAGDRNAKLGWHFAVGRDHYPDLYDEGWLRRSISGRRPRPRPVRRRDAA